MGAKRNQGGRPKGTVKVAGTRAWFRNIVENPELRAQVESVIREAVLKGDLTDYWKAVEHGFGRPPQALDVKVGPGEGGPLVFEVQLDDGSPAFATPESLPTEASS